MDRCLQADIQAVWATLPCRERDSEKVGGQGRRVQKEEMKRCRKDYKEDEEENTRDGRQE